MEKPTSKSPMLSSNSFSFFLFFFFFEKSACKTNAMFYIFSFPHWKDSLAVEKTVIANKAIASLYMDLKQYQESWVKSFVILKSLAIKFDLEYSFSVQNLPQINLRNIQFGATWWMTRKSRPFLLVCTGSKLTRKKKASPSLPSEHISKRPLLHCTNWAGKVTCITLEPSGSFSFTIKIFILEKTVLLPI